MMVARDTPLQIAAPAMHETMEVNAEAVHLDPVSCISAGAASDSQSVYESTLSSASLPLPTIPSESIKIQHTLGSGAHCTVKAATIVDRYGCNVRNRDGNTRQSIAVKMLRASLAQEDSIRIAVDDLLAEASILARLDHPNIVQVHGKSSASIQTLRSTEETHVLLMEKLDSTLAQQLTAWRKTSTTKNRIFRKLVVRPFRFGRAQRDTLARTLSMMERVHRTALGIASAMEYLHGMNIVFRDLKPANIGFDRSGNVKIFDFGFARNINDCRKGEMAGSPRYMAPEVFGGETSFRSDVYSFGVLLYEICSLQKPYTNVRSCDELTRLVVEERFRPSLDGISSKTLRRLIASCWDHDPANRPSFAEIVRSLMDVTGSQPLQQQTEQTSSEGRWIDTGGRSQRRLALTASSIFRVLDSFDGSLTSMSAVDGDCDNGRSDDDDDLLSASF